MSEAGWIEREEHEWGPGGQPSASKQIDFSKRKRGMGIFDAINENLKAKDKISYQAQENRKTAKELAESYKKGSTKISDDATVVEGYQDQGYTLPGVQGRSFGGLIGTGLGAVAGGIFGGPGGAMKGAQFGSKVGSYF